MFDNAWKPSEYGFPALANLATVPGTGAAAGIRAPDTFVIAGRKEWQQ